MSQNEVRTIDPTHEYAQQLMSPEWHVIEEHFDAKVPSVLKEFYEDPSQVLQTDFEVDSPLSKMDEGIYIEAFCEIGEDSLIGSFDDMERYFPFARGLGGEEYVIDIKEDDPGVFYFQYDVGEDPERLQDTGLSLSQFLEAKKKASTRLHDE